MIFFGCTCGMHNFPGQGSTPNHSSDNTRSLTARPPGNSRIKCSYFKHLQIGKAIQTRIFTPTITLKTGDSWSWSLRLSEVEEPQNNAHGCVPSTSYIAQYSGTVHTYLWNPTENPGRGPRKPKCQD